MNRSEYVEPIVHIFVVKEKENESSTPKPTTVEPPSRIQPCRDDAFLVNQRHAHFDIDQLLDRPTWLLLICCVVFLARQSTVRKFPFHLFHNFNSCLFKCICILSQRCSNTCCFAWSISRIGNFFQHAS